MRIISLEHQPAACGDFCWKGGEGDGEIDPGTSIA